MSLLQQAADLNNQGITSLLSGNYQTGIEALSDSIKMMKRQLASPSSKSEELESTSMTSNSISTVELTTTNAHAHAHANTNANEGSSTSTFNQMFRIPHTEDDVAATQDMRVYAGAVIFNLALAYHTQPQQQQQPGKSVEKAQKLYQMILKLLDPYQSGHEYGYAGLMIQLACINNLSQLYSDADRSVDTIDIDDVATELVRKLRSIVSSVDAAANNDHEMMFFEDTKLQGLLINVLMLKAPQVAAAA